MRLALLVLAGCWSAPIVDPTPIAWPHPRRLTSSSCSIMPQLVFERPDEPQTADFQECHVRWPEEYDYCCYSVELHYAQRLIEWTDRVIELCGDREPAP